MAAISPPEKEFGAHKRAYFGKRARNAVAGAAVAVGVTLASISPSSAQQAVPVAAPAATTQTMSLHDCVLVKEYFIELTKEPAIRQQHSAPFMRGMIAYLKNGCSPVSNNGEGAEIPLQTDRDDLTAGQLGGFSLGGKVTLNKTGIKFSNQRSKQGSVMPLNQTNRCPPPCANQLAMSKVTGCKVNVSHGNRNARPIQGPNRVSRAP